MIPPDLGLTLIYPDTPGITLTNRAGRRCSYIQGASLYFRVGDEEDDDTGSWRDATANQQWLVGLLYLDVGTTPLQIGYTSDGTTETVETIVTPTNTGKWLLASHTLAGTARAAHSLYADFGSADLRLTSDGELYLAAVLLYSKDNFGEVRWFADSNRTNVSLGNLIAGGGNVTLDSGGVTLVPGSASPNLIKWANGSDSGAASLGATSSASLDTAVLFANKAAVAQSGYVELIAQTSALDDIIFKVNATLSGSVYANLYSDSLVGATFAGFSIGGAGGVPNAMLDVHGGGLFAGNLLFNADATYDIGASGATRPRDLFLSRNLTAGGTGTFSGAVTIDVNTVATPLPQASTNLQITGPDGSANRITADAYGANNAWISRRANGTAGALTAVVTDNILGAFSFSGYNGSIYNGRAQITGNAAENWVATTNEGTYLAFLTTLIGATALVERLRIDGAGAFQYWDGGNFILGTTTGTKIGTATNQKIGVWGATPIIQGTAFNQTAYTTATHTVANVTATNPPAGGTGATAGAYDTAAHRDAMITSLTNLIADVANIKQVLNAVIDDHQAIGWLA